MRGRQRPFGMAGLWVCDMDTKTGEEVKIFAIITTTANSLISKLGLKRMPVILYNEYESTWLRTSAQLGDILSMLCPYPANLMNAYSIDDKINDKTLNDISVIQPVGKPVYHEPVNVWQRKPKRENSFPNATLADRMGFKKDG